MKNKSITIMNEKVVSDTIRELGIEDGQIAESFIKKYYENLQKELINGKIIKTPLGDLQVVRRNLNTNVSDKTFTYKLVYKIKWELKNFLETRKELQNFLE